LKQQQELKAPKGLFDCTPFTIVIMQEIIVQKDYQQKVLMQEECQ
jgi:hypothetical protein